MTHYFNSRPDRRARVPSGIMHMWKTSFPFDFRMSTKNLDTVWLGLTKVSGKWKWQDGTPYVFKAWRVSNLPYDNIHCATMKCVDPVYTWYEQHCANQWYYICEKGINVYTGDFKMQSFPTMCKRTSCIPSAGVHIKPLW